MLIEVEHVAVSKIKHGISNVKGVQVAMQQTQPWLSDDDSPRCKHGVTYTGHLRATGPDQPGILEKVTNLLASLELDITSLECKQHMTISGTEHKPQQLFQIEGAVRSARAKRAGKHAHIHTSQSLHSR